MTEEDNHLKILEMCSLIYKLNGYERRVLTAASHTHGPINKRKGKTYNMNRLKHLEAQRQRNRFKKAADKRLHVLFGETNAIWYHDDHNIIYAMYVGPSKIPIDKLGIEENAHRWELEKAFERNIKL